MELKSKKKTTKTSPEPKFLPQSLWLFEVALTMVVCEKTKQRQKKKKQVAFLFELFSFSLYLPFIIL